MADLPRLSRESNPVVADLQSAVEPFLSRRAGLVTEGGTVGLAEQLYPHRLVVPRGIEPRPQGFQSCALPPELRHLGTVSPDGWPIPARNSFCIPSFPVMCRRPTPDATFASTSGSGLSDQPECRCPTVNTIAHGLFQVYIRPARSGDAVEHIEPMPSRNLLGVGVNISEHQLDSFLLRHLIPL